MTSARADIQALEDSGGRLSKGWKRYPKYRNSGAAWLGEVPANWRIARIKNLLPAQRSPARDEVYKLALENITSWTGKIIGSSPELEGEGLAFDRGDVLFGKLRPYLAKACVADQRGAAVGDFFVMRPAQGVIPSYCTYLLLTREFIALIDGSTFGARMPRADWDFFSNQTLPIPELAEQRAIADFLDRETGRIDALIAKRERQIELLQEKRQTLITHAVTKGLDPDATMKDSGVEWLGEIPDGWHVQKLRFLCRIQGGATPSKAEPSFWIGDVPWVTPKDMKVSRIGDSELHISEDALSSCSLPLIDSNATLIVVRGMILAHSFPVAMNTCKVTINQDMKALTPAEASLYPLQQVRFHQIRAGAHRHQVGLRPSWRYVLHHTARLK